MVTGTVAVGVEVVLVVILVVIVVAVHYATNRQVAGSIPDGVIGIFQ
jgi:hypothetical protein